MEFSAKTIADFVNGKIIGDANVVVNSISKIESGEKDSLTFLANPKYTNFIYSTNASIVLVENKFELEKPINATLIKVENPYLAIASLLELYNKSQPELIGIDKLAFVDSSAIIGKNAYIGAFTYVSKSCKIGNNVKIYPQVFIGDNVEIDDNCIINPGVKIYHKTKIGKNCIIHAGTVIGSDGFGFAPKNDKNYLKIPQIGNVVIEDDVEIGANVTIDRSTMGSTIIRHGVKLDNLIQVGHNVEIGENTVISAHTAIAGSTKLGKDIMVGGQVGFAGHLSVANGVKIGGQSGISSNIKKENDIICGSPAFSINDYKKATAIFKDLPSLRNKIIELENQIKELKLLINN